MNEFSVALPMSAEQHDRAALCFYCAPDREIERALAGMPHRPIDMGADPAACPFWTTPAAPGAVAHHPTTDTTQEATDVRD